MAGILQEGNAFVASVVIFWAYAARGSGNHRITIALLLVSLIGAAVSSGQSPSPETRTRQVLDLFFAGKYDAVYDMFADETKKALPLKVYKAQSAQIRALGQPESIGQARSAMRGGGTVVSIPIRWPATALDFGVRWNRAAQITGIWFTAPAQQAATSPLSSWTMPEYSNPDSFVSTDVTIGDDEWKLLGTVSVPKGRGPFPGLVLVHGSGPHDRDETIGGTRPFRDLAQGLASRGIAVIRYAKRTKAYPAKCAADPKFTINEETVEDALRAASFLRTQESVDFKRAFVLGHSQGGYVAPRIAARDPKLAGLIILAGNVRPLEDLILEQSEYLSGLNGEPGPGQRAQLEELRREVEKVKKLEPEKRNTKLLGLPSAYLLDLKGYNPAVEAKRLSIPMLILQGQRDYQVTMKDFALWQTALHDRRDVIAKSYPKLNHLFVTGEGKSTPAEYENPGHVAPEVIEDIVNWIRSVQAVAMPSGEGPKPYSKRNSKKTD